MSFVVGKLYQFIDRNYYDYFYLVEDREKPPTHDLLLFLRDSFILLEIGSPCNIMKTKTWIRVLSNRGIVGWFKIEESWLEEMVDE